MDEEYARKKALMDWIVAGMAGRHYPKPAAPDKTAVAPPTPVEAKPEPKQEDDRPYLVKKLGQVPLPKKAKERLNIKPYSEQQKLNEETFHKTHADVLKERLGDFEGRERMGDSLDNEHNLPFGTPFLGIFPTPTGLYNKYHKEKLREAFDEIGFPRKQ